VNSIQSTPPPTFDTQRQLARAQAQKLLARRRRRLRSIRKRAIAGSVAAFAAAWVAIGVQLASGHDPALSKNTPAAAVAGSKSTNSGSTNSGSTDSSSTDSSSTDSSSSSSSQQLAPVTTQQS
jgi:hypothetical protein